MLIDSIHLTVRAGSGGNGAKTFRRDAMTARGGPDGGNGGNGGSIYFKGSSNIHDLAEFQFQKKIAGVDGVAGAKHNAFGKNAPDLHILVPLGTRITDEVTGKKIEITDDTTDILIAKGGIGGRGNVAFKSATNQSPKYAEVGTLGEKRKLFLELRLIAEVGLIGLPNAGKSSLLSQLTRATPNIANYPFTTLEPNIGMMGRYPIADIPGLIEGASQGKGLGIKFLKHIEKTKVLVHCIDITSDDVYRDYETVRHEFEHYNAKLLKKPEILYLNKTDLVERDTVVAARERFTHLKKKIITGSIFDPGTIEEIKDSIKKLL